MKRSASRVTRDLHRKCLLPADEAVAEHDLGTLRQHVLDQTVLPVHSHNVLLGLSHRHVFVYGGRRPSFAVPLADVVTVETFHSMVTVTYLDGEAVGHFHWQRAKPGDVERLAGLIRAGAERSASAAAAALRADVEESWRYQARRSRPASRQAERTMRNGVRESMSVRVLGVVSDPNDAPPPSLEPGRWPDELWWCGGDRFILSEGRGATTEIDGRRITYLAIDEVSGSGGAAANWELGWMSDSGEMRVFFQGRALALWPGQMDESAGAFLCATGLPERAGSQGVSGSWRRAQPQARQPSRPSRRSDGAVGRPTYRVENHRVRRVREQPGLTEKGDRRGDTSGR